MTISELQNMEGAPIVQAAAPAELSDIASVVRAKGVLVSLEITTWSGRRLDKRVTDDTNAREGADSDAGRFNKNLLGGKVDSFAAVVAAAGAARTAHYRETLPWSDEGSRLLPIGNYFEYSAMVRQQRETFKGAVETFLAEYPAICQAAAAKLGAMYNPADYPPASDIAKKFTFRIHFAPVPAASDIRVDLPAEVLTHMEKSVTARVENAVQAAVLEGWQRLAESVQRISVRLREISGAEKGRLHAPLFSSAVETAATLKRLNVLSDPKLDAMADRVIAELSGLDPKTIRQEPDAMEAAATAADKILADMSAIYGGGAA